MAEKPIRVVYSELTGRFYATSRYRQEGRLLVITGKKYDVTQDVARAVVENELEFTPVDVAEKEGR